MSDWIYWKEWEARLDCVTHTSLVTFMGWLIYLSMWSCQGNRRKQSHFTGVAESTTLGSTKSTVLKLGSKEPSNFACTFWTCRSHNGKRRESR